MILLHKGNLRAEIAPEAGASLVSFAFHRGEERVQLMRSTPPAAIQTRDAWSMASFILAPFSNIIPQGRFWFESQVYQLAPNYEGNSAIHGDVYRHSWHVKEASADSLVCTLDSRGFPDFNFPFPIAAEARYLLSGDGLISSLTLTNTGAQAMPAGLGFHPFFNRCFAGREDWPATLQFHATGVYPKLPSGPMLPVPPMQDFSNPVILGEPGLNHCFGGWDGRARIAYSAAGVALDLDCDPVFSHVVVFTPRGGSYFCVEPVSHANNAFNLAAAGQADTGMRILAPGESMGGAFKVRIDC